MNNQQILATSSCFCFALQLYTCIHATALWLPILVTIRKTILPEFCSTGSPEILLPYCSLVILLLVIHCLCTTFSSVQVNVVPAYVGMHISQDISYHITHWIRKCDVEIKLLQLWQRLGLASLGTFC